MKRVIAFFMIVLTVTTIFTMGIPVHAALYDSPEECLAARGSHTFQYDVVLETQACRYCDYVCDHPEDKRVLYNDNNTLGSAYEIIGEKHHRRWQCSICHQEGYNEKGVACKWKITKTDTYSDEHIYTCKTCGNTKTGKCKYKMIYKGVNDKSHTIRKHCTICKTDRVISKTSAKHKYKNNKCTVCGFKRIIPGALKIKSATCPKKGVKKTYTVDAHWEKSGGKWVWKEAYKYSRYVYNINLKLTSKNATQFIVSTKKDYTVANTNSHRQLFKKGNCTYKYQTTNNKKAKKVTLYITPVSKTGTYGKTVKKVVTLKN